MEYNVIIPKDFFSVFRFIQDDKNGVAAINTALRGLEHKIIFSWHFSIMLHLKKPNEFGMPDKDENIEIEKFENKIQKLIINNKTKPNAIFLGRITWNGTVELIWRVFEPGVVNDIIKDIIDKKDYPMYFDYRIDPDREWLLAEWHLKDREYNINES